MQNLLNELKATLQNDDRLVVDGNLMKNKIVERALAMDAGLLALLLGNTAIKKQFFKDVADVLVFDKVAFQSFVSNKQFLPNSYTAFKNKIGLTANGEYLTESREVVLAWPYKDCTLEGGQTKEDQKRKEIFWNETLAPDEIDRLLEPKVLTNFKRYDKDGEHKVARVGLDDNLVIKGNNLLALHCLKKQYAGKVKLIYIDPPYNTGKDGFKYNDSFNHSAWLTFMKNRLEAAKTLLRDDGSFWISLNDDELHYAKVLCDEVFGRDNFISTIIWHSKYTTSNDAKYVSYQHENLLFYANNKSLTTVGGFDRTEEHNKSYKNPDNDPKGVWKATPIHAKSGNIKNNYLIKFPNGYRWTPPPGRYPRYSKERLLKIFQDNGLYFNKNGGVDKKTYLSEVKSSITPGSVWNYSDVGHTHANNEELAKLLGKGQFDNPKGTALIAKICKVGNVKANDIILDYHAGSGTTAHAVLELNKEDGWNRQFIMVEQMDYIETVTNKRVKKVIKQNKQGSFTYCELTQHNANIIDKIEQADTTKTLISIWHEMENTDLISYKIKPETINQNIHEFEALSIAEQKQLLIAVLDKNQLYVNYSEIDDVDYKISDEDKKLNKQFYGD